MSSSKPQKIWTRKGTSQNHEVYGLTVGDSHVGFVTVDLKNRGFRFGMHMTEGPMDSGSRAFIGRGWRERLIETAKTALENSGR